MLNLFRFELFSRWRAILGLGLGLTAFAAIYIFIYPEVAEEFASLGDLSIYRAFGIELVTFGGFIASVVVQILPIILSVYVLLLATGTLAGEEDNGTLEMVVAMPLRRWQIVTTKTLALLGVVLMITILFGIGSALCLSIVAGWPDVSVDATPFQLFVALLGTFPLMVAFFGIGLFLGTITPGRRLAFAFGVLILIVSYLLNSVAGLVESLAWVKQLSLFGYVDATGGVFSAGLDPVNVLVLMAIGGVFFLLAVWGFQGRNITVGQWPWQRRLSHA